MSFRRVRNFILFVAAYAGCFYGGWYLGNKHMEKTIPQHSLFAAQNSFIWTSKYFLDIEKFFVEYPNGQSLGNQYWQIEATPGRPLTFFDILNKKKYSAELAPKPNPTPAPAQPEKKKKKLVHKEIEKK